MQEGEKFFVHESSYIDENVTIGVGTKIWHFSHGQSESIIGKNSTIGQNVNISNNVRIGSNVKIQNNVSIYEGVQIEDYVFCGPSMVFTNILVPRSEFPQRGTKYYKKTIVKKSASIGANATIICGNKIGKYSLIGAGAVITKDVPDFALVLGNPGKIVGWVDKKGARIHFNESGESICGKFLLSNNTIINIK